jgi:uncharacterized ion transporter superfamily protein YfcC
MPKKKIPDTLAIVFVLLLAFAALTWIIPSGEYSRAMLDGRKVIEPGTFEYKPGNPAKLETILTAPIRGFVKSANIIAFIFIVGGAFTVLNRTGAIEAGILWILGFSRRHPGYKKLIIPAVMILFSMGGATFGMSEEVLAFILITIPLARSLGYDVITGTAIPFIGATTGFASAMFNPFTVGIAQGIAGVEIFSGFYYRTAVWLIMTCVSVGFVVWYASRLDKKKIAGFFTEDEHEIEENNLNKLDIRKGLILLLVLLSFAGLVIGVNNFGWYINEISGLFFAMGLLAAIIGRLGAGDTVAAFIDGAKDMVNAGLIIGLSRAILILAEDGMIIDTILNYVATHAADLPNWISIQVMFAFQGGLNFFIPSGSGQAALTMPVMAPLADVLGISRQAAVLAFQFGDGLSNLIIPTSGVTMGVLSIAKIPYGQWLRWIWPLMALLLLCAVLLLVPPVLGLVPGW